MDLSKLYLQRLCASFYQRKNVLVIARELLGKILVTNFDGRVTAGMIVETEAYNGITDKASHAYNGRKTRRTEIMYKAGGVAYVYLCYGIHHLFNVVTNAEDVPHAVLIRAIEPLYGVNEMMAKCEKKQFDSTLTKGPGNLSKALGISTECSGFDLCGDNIFIADIKKQFKKSDIITTARIGVKYAAEDALLPYRFFIKNNLFVSQSKKNI